MNAKKFAPMLLAVVAVFCAGAASAAIVVEAKNSSQDVDNVLSNPQDCAGTITGPATLIQGCLQDKTVINFKSNEFIQITGGQSAITAVDGGFSQLEIFVNGINTTFDKLVLNIGSADDGFVTFLGTPGGSSDQLKLKGGGSNFFTITGDAGEGFSSIFFQTTTSVVTELTQVRIGGAGTGITPTPNNNVPEPATLALLGAALLGVAASRKRKV